MKTLARWFVQGLIVLLPLATTLGVVTFVFSKVDNLFQFGGVAAPAAGAQGGDPSVTGPAAHGIPGLGFVLSVVTITAVGWMASFFLGRWLVRITDWLIGRIPLVSSIYRTIKDILLAIGGDKKTFEHPVVITPFRDSTMKLLGFVTRDDLAEIGLPGEVAVLLQQSLNFAGNLVVLPKSQVRALDVDSGRFLTFLMSGGLTGHLSAPPDEDKFPRLDEPEPTPEK
jgi:uncharacterized membrane protein